MPRAFFHPLLSPRRFPGLRFSFSSRVSSKSLLVRQFVRLFIFYQPSFLSNGGGDAGGDLSFPTVLRPSWQSCIENTCRRKKKRESNGTCYPKEIQRERILTTTRTSETAERNSLWFFLYLLHNTQGHTHRHTQKFTQTRISSDRHANTIINTVNFTSRISYLPARVRRGKKKNGAGMGEEKEIAWDIFSTISHVFYIHVIQALYKYI